MNLKKDPALLIIGLAVLAIIGLGLLSNLSEAIRTRSRQSNGRPDGAHVLKQAMPLESFGHPWSKSTGKDKSF